MLGSLRSRLALSNLAISLAALIVLTVIFGQLLRQRTIDSNTSFVNQEAHLVQADVKSAVKAAFRPLHPIRPARFFGRFRTDSNLFEKRIVFYAASGVCQFDSGESARAARATSCGHDVDWRINTRDPSKTASGLINRGGNSYYAVQLPVGHSAVVVVVAPAEEVVPGLGVLAPGLILALCAAAIIWILMSLFFGYTVSRPLAKITSASRAIAAGDYTQTVHVGDKGEIGELSSAFNHMVQQVRLTNQTLKDFVANVSHDLRTPITVISGFAGSLLDGTMRETDEVQEAARIISDEARRMEHLVDDLLQLTRLESGLRRFEYEPVNLADLADRTVQRASAAHSGRTIESRNNDTLPLVLGDEELLERALMNLLTNAIQYTPSDGSIAVIVDRLGDGRVKLSVSDTGTGISPEDQARIFERFYRTDRSRTGDGHSGLGLAIVKEIAEAHHGGVELASQVGKGATFSLLLPSFDPES